MQDEDRARGSALKSQLNEKTREIKNKKEVRLLNAARK
jgi:hypothetical protein